MNARILVVEDDPNFGETLCFFLEEVKNYSVTLATDGEKGAKAFHEGTFDLCILDVMMPKKDGFSLAEEIRTINPHIPIIFVTAKSMKEDVIRGFRIGADDYITKPFDSEELSWRIQALLKRTVTKTEPIDFQIGRFHFNYPLRLLTIDGDVQKLSPKEAELLKLFSVYMNDVTPRSEALNKIWKEDSYFTARSMDVFVTKLRKFLAPDPNVEIVNIHSNGFQLKVREAATNTETGKV